MHLNVKNDEAHKLAVRLMKIGHRYATLPDTGRSPDEILGYDEHGLPT